MTWLYLIILVISALTLYFTCGAYRKGQFPKKAFLAVCISEAVVIIGEFALLVLSL